MVFAPQGLQDSAESRGLTAQAIDSGRKKRLNGSSSKGEKASLFMDNLLEIFFHTVVFAWGRWAIWLAFFSREGREASRSILND